MKLSALALIASSLIAAPGLQDATLRLKPKKNQVYTYTTISDVASGTGELKSTSSHVTTSMKVISVGKDEIKLLTTIEDIKSDARGAAEARAMKITYTASPLWQIKDVTAEGGGASGQVLVNSLRAALMVSPAFPEKAVKPGDEWSIELDLAQLFASMYDGFLKVKGEAKAPLKIKLAKIETKEDRKVAVIETTMDAAFALDLSGREAPATWKIESTADFDLQTGMSVSQKVTQTQTVDVGNGSKLTIVTKTTTTLDSVK